MAREDPIITNFTAGELSPSVGSRTRLQWWRNGLRLLQNMISTVLGPAVRRPGTRYIATTINSDKAVLIDFEFSTEQAYAIVASALRFRFIRDRIQILDDAVVVNGGFSVDLSGWTDISNGTGSVIQNSGAMDLIGVGAGNEAEATQNIADIGIGLYEFTFDVIGGALRIKVGTTSGASDLANEVVAVGVGQVASFQPLTHGEIWVTFRNENSDTRSLDNVSLSNPIYEIDTPYAEADLNRIKWTQSFDVLYLEHPSYEPRKLSRRGGNAAWSLEIIDFQDGPYFRENADDALTLQPSATTGTITITAAGFVVGEGPFVATDIGRLVRIKHTNWGNAKITVFTSDILVTAEVKSDFDLNTAVPAWRLGLWSETTGFPVMPIFHQERLWHAGAAQQPDRFDSSVTGDFENMTPGPNDDDPISRVIASNKVNAIRWLASGDVLFIGTLSREFRVVPDEFGAAVTPGNVDAKRASVDGSADIMPLEIGSDILFVQRFGREIINLLFDPGGEQFVGIDIARRSEHLTRGGIISWAYQRSPFRLIWAALAGGELRAWTYVREEEVVAAHRHPLGGGAKVESLISLPAETYTEVYMLTAREINGQTRRFVEVLEDAFTGDQPPEDAYFVDAGLSLDNTIAATLTIDAVSGSGVLFTAGAASFVAGDVGRFIRYRYQPLDAEGDFEVDDDQDPIFETAIAEIVGFTSTTIVTCDILVAFPSTAVIAAAAWRMTVSAVSGADHMEGATAQIIGDGAPYPDVVVPAGGIVTIDPPAATIHLGFGSVAKLKPVRLDAGALGAGTAQGKLKRISRVVVRLYRSLGFNIGRDAGSLEVQPFRRVGDRMDQPPPLFSGDKDVTFPSDYERDGNILIVQDQALPLTVVALMPKVDTKEP